MNYFFGESALTLTFVYVVLVLPYAHRAIDAALAAIDLQTLSEAARSLGASWTTTIVRVVVPNIWSGVLSAAFISIAVVIGEFTIASLWLREPAGRHRPARRLSDGPTAVAARWRPAARLRAARRPVPVHPGPQASAAADPPPRCRP